MGFDGVKEAAVVVLGADETDAVQGGVVHPPLVELHLRRQEAVPRDIEIWLVQLLICLTSRFLCTPKSTRSSLSLGVYSFLAVGL